MSQDVVSGLEEYGRSVSSEDRAAEDSSLILDESHDEKTVETPHAVHTRISNVLSESSSTRNNSTMTKLSDEPQSPFRPPSRSSSTKENDESSILLSLLPCRKVSVVVRVLQSRNDAQPCLFSIDSPHNLVVVNPTAFGKYIPAEVTMETAKLVAQVAHVETEDWARLYRFDKIVWNSPLDQLAQAVANDASVYQRSSVCFGLGKESLLMSNGFLEMVLQRLWYPHNQVCTLSIMEIAEENDLRDLLSTKSARHTPLRLRYPDHCGAVVYNLTELPVDSLQNLKKLLDKAFHANSKKGQAPRGHIICTVKVWQNNPNSSENNDCTILGFVDLAAAAVESTSDTCSSSVTQHSERKRRRVAFARKSLSSLRGVLRGLLLKDANPATTKPISYRECTLTKVLQRVLEQPDSRAAVISTVSSNTKDYERTLETLNFSNRLLLRRPSDTAQSPFHVHSHKKNKVDITSPLDPYAEDSALLRNVLSDPRQRLAKVMVASPSPTRPKKSPIELTDKDNHVSHDYMTGMEEDDRIMTKILSGPHSVKRALWTSQEENDVESNVETKKSLVHEFDSENVGTEKVLSEIDTKHAESWDAPQARDTEIPSVTPGNAFRSVRSSGDHSPDPFLYAQDTTDPLITGMGDKTSVPHGPTVSESDESSPTNSKSLVRNIPPLQTDMDHVGQSQVGKHPDDEWPHDGNSAFVGLHEQSSTGSQDEASPRRSQDIGAVEESGKVTEVPGDIALFGLKTEATKEDMVSSSETSLQNHEWVKGTVGEDNGETDRASHSHQPIFSQGATNVDSQSNPFWKLMSSETRMELEDSNEEFYGDHQEIPGEVGAVPKSPLDDYLEHTQQTDEYQVPMLSESDESDRDDLDLDDESHGRLNSESFAAPPTVLPQHTEEAPTDLGQRSDGEPNVGTEANVGFEQLKSLGTSKAERPFVEESRGTMHFSIESKEGQEGLDVDFGSRHAVETDVDEHGLEHIGSATSEAKVELRDVGQTTVGAGEPSSTVYNLPAEIRSEFRRLSHESDLDLRNESGTMQYSGENHQTGMEIAPSSSDVIDEISVLETVVDEVKKMHSGLYESSAYSLEKLRESHLSNQHQLQQALSAKVEAEKEVEALLNEIDHQRQYHNDSTRGYEEKISELDKRLRHALEDKAAIETIAEDAITAQDKLEHDISGLNEQLLINQRETEELISKYDTVIASRDSLSLELDETTAVVEALRTDSEKYETSTSNLKETIQELEAERAHLLDASAHDHRKLEELLHDATVHEETKGEVELLRAEVSRLKLDNEELNAALMQRDRDVAHVLEHESQLETIKEEASGLSNALRSSRRHFEEESSYLKNSIQSLEQERLQLRTELSDAKKTLQETSTDLAAAVEAKETAIGQAEEALDLTNEMDAEIKQHVAEVERLGIEKANDRDRIVRLQQTCEELQRKSAAAAQPARLESERSPSASMKTASDDNRAYMDENTVLRETIERLQSERATHKDIIVLREQIAFENLARSQAEERNAALQSKLEESEMAVQELREEVNRIAMSGSNESEAFLLRQLEAERRNVDIIRSKLEKQVREANESQRQNEVLRSLVTSQQPDNHHVTRDAVPMETFRIEQIRRRQAEELTAAMAARAKAGLDMRNEEIVQLKMRLSTVMDEKESEIYLLRTKLHAMEKYHAVERKSSDKYGAEH